MRVLFILINFAFAACIWCASFGNPAELPPQASVCAAAEYSRQFLYTANDNYSCEMRSQRFLVRIGYVFYRWLELYGYIGGADADLTKTNIVKDYTKDSNGSWELAPGAGLRIKPPLKFSALGLKFHMLLDGKYLFIRSRQEVIYENGWYKKGKLNINEFSGAGMFVGQYRRFNLWFYAGVAARYVWAEMPYTANSTITIGSSTITLEDEGTELLGTSMSPREMFFPHMIFPILGINWNIGGEYVICFEANLSDISELLNLGPKVSFTLGVSHYK